MTGILLLEAGQRLSVGRAFFKPHLSRSGRIDRRAVVLGLRTIPEPVLLIGDTGNVDLAQATYRFAMQEAITVDPEQLTERCGVSPIRLVTHFNRAAYRDR